MIEVEFAAGSVLQRERDRRSHFPIVRNGPPGTFVVMPSGMRVSLPTDQIVSIDGQHGHIRVSFGGMEFRGVERGQLIFTRARELQPEEHLSPERSHRMTLDAAWVSAIFVDGTRVWPSTVYKIVPRHLWEQSAASGEFTGSLADQRDGFMHLSTASQLRETASRHFAGRQGLLLVAVDINRVELRWEPSRGGHMFPHLYGPLPHYAVTWIREIPLDERGHHVFPDLT